MPARVNTKFVFVLAGVLVILVVGLVGFWYVFINRSADAYLRRAERYLSEGDVVMAIPQLERAISKRPTDVGLLDKYIGVLDLVNAPNPVKARVYFSKIQNAVRATTDLTPADEQRLDAYYRLLDGFGRDLNARPAYNNIIYDLANARLDAYPDNLTARKWRGAVQTRRLTADMPLADREQAREDLAQVLEQRPDDPQALHNLAMWNLFEAGRVDPPGQSVSDQVQLGQQLRDEALRLSRLALDTAPDDLEQKLQRLEVLLHPQFVDKDQLIHADEASALIDQLESALLENPQPPHAILRVSRVLPILDPAPADPDAEQATQRRITRGRLRAELLLRAAIEADAQNIAVMYALGQLQKQMGQQSEALATFMAARELGEVGPALKVLQAADLRVSAAFEAANLLLMQSAAAQTPEEKKQLREQAVAITTDIEKLNKDSPAVDVLRGKLLLADGQTRQGLQRIDRASSQMQDRNPELLLISANARRQLREYGAAADRLQQLLKLLPNNPAIRLDLARVYLQARQGAAAEREIETVLQADPGNPDALRLQATLLAASPNRVADAIAALEAIGARDDTKQRSALGQLYARAGRVDEARELLTQSFNENPADLRTLQALANLTPDLNDQLALVQQARDQGADRTAVDILERQLRWLASDTGQGADAEQRRAERSQMLQEAMQARIEAEDDPARKAIAEARLHLGLGERDQAEAALGRAKEVNPDHPALVQLEFELALQDQAWDVAEQKVEQAARLDLDLAKGDFLRGRLEAARNRAQPAIAAYRRALTLQPVHSEGWRQLGVVLARNDDFDEAAAALEKAIAQRPDNASALRTLSGVELKREQPDRALELIREALRYAPNDRSLLNQYLAMEQQYGNAERALEMRRQLAELDPGDLANRRAMILLEARVGQTETAIAQAQQMADENPDDRSAVVMLATAHRIGGDPASGRKVIERFLASRGSDATAEDRVALARYLVQINNGDALKAYQAARAMEDPQTRPVSRELGDLLFGRGMHDRAVVVYRELHQTDPQDQTVALRLAETLVKLSEFDEAQQVLATIDRQRIELDVLEAIIAANQGREEDALRKLNAALKSAPRRAELYVQRAAILAKDPQRLADAQRDLNQALTLNPGLVVARQTLAQLYLQRGEVAEARRELRNLLSRTPAYVPARVQLINLSFQRGDATGARSLIQEGEELFPNQATWPSLAARLAAQQQDLPGEIAGWRRALALQPDPGVVANLTVALIRNDQPTEALQVLSEQVDLVQNEPALKALRGRALAADGQAEPARQVFLNALRQTRNFPQFAAVAGQARQTYPPDQAADLIGEIDTPAQVVWSQIVLAQIDMAQRRFAEAAARLQTASERVGDEALRNQIRQMRAISLQSNGDVAEAASTYRELLETQPENVGALNNLAFLLASDLNDPRAAMPLAEKAAGLAPQNARVLDTLGLVQLMLEDPESARSTLERSLAIEPFAANCYHLGMVYAQTNRPERAAEMFRRAIEMAEQEQDSDMMNNAQTALAALTQE